MRNDRLMKILVLFTVGLISMSLYAADEVSEQGIPIKGMVITKVHLGEMVKKGQILFSLELAPLKLQEDIDKNNLFYAELVYKRDVMLNNKKAQSYMNLWSAKTDYLSARSKFLNEEVDIKRATSKAPFDGEVTKIVSYTGSAIPDGGDVVEVTKTDKPIPITTPAVDEVMNFFEDPIIMDVKLGQKVKKGQLLFSTSVKKFTISLDSEKAQLELDKNTFAKITKGYKSHAISYDGYEKARVAYDNAIDTVKADLENIKQSKCYAPFDGTVTKIVAYTNSTMGSAAEIVDVTKSPATAPK